MLNRITLMGRLTRDPDLRQTKGAEPQAWAVFGLAVDRDYKSKDGNKITDFFEVVAWRKKAEFISRYFKKGQLVYIEGRLQRDTWEDENKQKRSNYKIVVENCYFADQKRVEDKATTKTDKSANLFDQPDDNDDLPF